LGNNAIRMITPSGTVSTLAGSGLNYYADGTGAAASFSSPQGLAIDPTGKIIYIADRGNNLIRQVTTSGVVITLAGALATTITQQQTLTAGYQDGTQGLTSYFNRPTSLALDQNGGLFICDVNNRAIRDMNLTSQATSTVVGNTVQKALLGAIAAITSDAKGNLFVADQGGRVLEITTDKVIYVLAGASNTASFADGVGAAARFNQPMGIAVDANGVVYVADFGNNCIRKLVISVQ
jgi:DNA-binding beta-propeller fold protein YncE